MEKANDQTANNGVTQHEELNGEQQEDVDLDEDFQAKERLTDADPNKVKFTSIKMDGYSDKNGDARVDIRLAQISVGMGKEELMKYANEPFWVRLRMFLFVLFWVSWAAMLVGAVAIIVLAPRCPPPPYLEWHQKTSMYRVMIKSFKDSDADGMGDIKGLTSELDYLQNLNVGTLLLSPFYAMASNFDGIVNHTSIDSRFGTMTDFEELLSEMKKRNMKLVIDFNPNHSSDQHPWFQASVKEEDPYIDFYVWADGADKGKPPNNWLSVNDTSAWTWNEERQQYYFHTFGKDLPELNLRDRHVKHELEEILRFWLEKGVDGFKVNDASYLVEDAGLRDEPLATEAQVDNRTYKDVSHLHTVGQPENFELFFEWREVLRNFSADVYKVMLAEVSESVNASRHYYGNASHPLADFPINTQLTHLTRYSTGIDLSEHIKTWLDVMPNGTWPNWQLGSEHTDRLSARVGRELIDGMLMVATLTRGTPIMYYGDELGIHYDPIPGHEHDLNQSPMQWNSGHLAGFSNATDSSMVLNPDYQEVNVEVQTSGEHSHLKIFKHLLSLRNQPAISLGVQEYPVVNEDIFSLLRVQKGSPGYLLVVNMGLNSTTTDFTGKSGYLPEKGRVEVCSVNIEDGYFGSGGHPQVLLNEVVLEPARAVVFSFVPVFKD